MLSIEYRNIEYRNIGYRNIEHRNIEHRASHVEYLKSKKLCVQHLQI